jgi:YesN/AraC family two-component response regulator
MILNFQEDMEVVATAADGGEAYQIENPVLTTA